MMTLSILLALLLLLLNAFFVLAEFAAVKARPTFIESLAAKGGRRARLMRRIQSHLDAYLSVCQIGITLSSIGLGFVAEPTFATLLDPWVSRILDDRFDGIATHGIAIGLSYLLVSYLHIVLGELVPKSFAIRRTEAAALWTAYPLQFFHYVFILPLWLLNASANLILAALRIPPVKGHGTYSEEEVRIILDHSQASGSMSFRRLLLLENVLDLGSLTARQAMRPLREVHSLQRDAPPQAALELFRRTRHSRYPVIDASGRPAGILHVKELLLHGESPLSGGNLEPYLKPFERARENQPIEELLSILQVRGNHMALVFDDAERWTGMVTLEDLLEEVVGTIEEEYPPMGGEAPGRLLETTDHVILDADGDCLDAVLEDVLRRTPPSLLPAPAGELSRAIKAHGRSGYVGRGLAIPHARLSGLKSPFVLFARLKRPLPVPSMREPQAVRYLLVLLTPALSHRLHQSYLMRVAKVFEREYFEKRLEMARTREDFWELFRQVEDATDLTP